MKLIIYLLFFLDIEFFLNNYKIYVMIIVNQVLNFLSIQIN